MSGANAARQSASIGTTASAPISAAAAALLFGMHFLEASFDAAAVQRVPLPVEAGAQAFCLAVQLAATLAPLFAVRPRRPIARWRRCPGATITAGQIAVHIADIADAAIYIGQRGALLTAVSPPHRVALLELYTSEGCSSCPPADRWLSELKLPRDQLIPLALHVDYWDSLGWPDPFAQRAFSERQQQLSRSVYTPERVLDGHEFRSDLMEAVKRINAEPARARITLTVDGATARARLETGTDHARLFLAAYENGLEVDVPRGENAGKRLRHDFVVRRLVESSTHDATLAIPAQIHGVVAFAQAPDGTILQADSLPLRSP